MVNSKAEKIIINSRIISGYRKNHCFYLWNGEHPGCQTGRDAVTRLSVRPFPIHGRPKDRPKRQVKCCNIFRKLQHLTETSWFSHSLSLYWPIVEGMKTLQWRHNDHDDVSNHQTHGCLLNRLFWRRSKKTSKLRVTGLCAGKSPGPVNSPHKGPVTRKMFPFDDVIMTHF